MPSEPVLKAKQQPELPPPIAVESPQASLLFVSFPPQLEERLRQELKSLSEISSRSLDSIKSLLTASYLTEDLACLHYDPDLGKRMQEIRLPCLVLGENISLAQKLDLLRSGALNVLDTADNDLCEIASIIAAYAQSNYSSRWQADEEAPDQSFIQAATSFASIEWDRDLTIKRWSNEAEILLGIRKSLAIGRSVGKWLLFPDEASYFISGCQSLCCGNLGNFKANCRIRNSENEFINASWKVIATAGSECSFIGIFELNENSERSPNQELQQLDSPPEQEPANERLDPSQIAPAYLEQAGFLAKAVEQLSIGVYVCDASEPKTITIWNEQMERLFHICKKQAIGKGLRSVISDPLLQAILGEAAIPHSRSRAIMPKATSKDEQGNDFIADISRTPIQNEEGKSVAIIGTVMDITERIQAENRLVAAFNELEASKEKLELSNLEIRKGIEKAKKLAVAAQASNRAKSFFLSNISHELRTPLTSIVSLTHALLEETFGPISERQREYLDIVSDSGKHLQSLITDILDLSKIELGKLALKVSKTPISDVAHASIRMISQQAKAKQVDCNIVIDLRTDTIEVDSKRLKQMLLNLLYNAVKFTRPQSEISLKLRSAQNDEAIVFEVSDNGIGIYENDIVNIFNPFTQLDDSLSKQYEGTGLGLAIVYKLVELHNGAISVESEPNLGSTFRITLPRKQPTNDPKEESRPLSHCTKSSPQAGSLAIIVEENENIASGLREMALKLGYANAVTSLPSELTAYYDQISPDIIIIDLPTLQSRGTEWIALAKEHPLWETTRWVATSSLDIAAIRAQALGNGFHSFVPKPITPSSFAGLFS